MVLLDTRGSDEAPSVVLCRAEHRRTEEGDGHANFHGEPSLSALAGDCEKAQKSTTMESSMTKFFMPLALSVSLLVASVAPALAVDVHNLAVGGTGMKGQPSQSIRTAATGFAVPGNANSFAKSKGSPFGSTAFSATKYAGAQPQNSKNPKSVAQYDVAGFQQSHNHLK